MNKTLKDLYFLFVLLFSGLSISFFRDHNGLIILWFIGLLIFWRKTIHPSKSLLIAIGVWLMYFAINSVLTKSFHPYFGFTYLAKIMIAYWLISNYGKYIYLKFENIIYYLSIISLSFYSIQLISPDFLFSILKKIDLSQDLYSNVSKYASIVIYTITSGEDASFYSYPRNAGFCWEPGPFSSYVALAFFIYLLRNKNLNFTKPHIFVFVLTIFSTQSTTGYLLLFLIIIWYALFRFKSVLLKMIMIPLLSFIVVFSFLKLPFLQNKIIIESNQDLEFILDNSSKSGQSYSPGRFASFQLGWIDFLNYPIAGLGGNLDQRFSNRQGSIVWSTNGFINILSNYGAIGMLVFLYLIISTGNWLSRNFRLPVRFIYPFLIIVISFGFSIIETPIFVTLLLTKSLFQNNPENKHKFNKIENLKTISNKRK